MAALDNMHYGLIVGCVLFVGLTVLFLVLWLTKADSSVTVDVDNDSTNNNTDNGSGNLVMVPLSARGHANTLVKPYHPGATHLRNIRVVNGEIVEDTRMSLKRANAITYLTGTLTASRTDTENGGSTSPVDAYDVQVQLDDGEEGGSFSFEMVTRVMLPVYIENSYTSSTFTASYTFELTVTDEANDVEYNATVDTAIDISGDGVSTGATGRVAEDFEVDFVNLVPLLNAAGTEDHVGVNFSFSQDLIEAIAVDGTFGTTNPKVSVRMYHAEDDELTNATDFGDTEFVLASANSDANTSYKVNMPQNWTVDGDSYWFFRLFVDNDAIAESEPTTIAGQSVNIIFRRFHVASTFTMEGGVIAIESMNMPDFSHMVTGELESNVKVQITFSANSDFSTDGGTADATDGGNGLEFNGDGTMTANFNDTIGNAITISDVTEVYAKLSVLDSGASDAVVATGKIGPIDVLTADASAFTFDLSLEERIVQTRTRFMVNAYRANGTATEGSTDANAGGGPVDGLNDLGYVSLNYQGEAIVIGTDNDGNDITAKQLTSDGHVSFEIQDDESYHSTANNNWFVIQSWIGHATSTNSAVSQYATSEPFAINALDLINISITLTNPDDVNKRQWLFYTENTGTVKLRKLVDGNAVDVDSAEIEDGGYAILNVTNASLINADYDVYDGTTAYEIFAHKDERLSTFVMADMTTAEA